MKKRFSKFCSLLLTFAVTATTVLSSDAMLLTTYADDEVAIVEEVAVEEVAVEAAEEVEEEISIADEVVIEDEVVINDAEPENAPGLYVDPEANLVVSANGDFAFNVFAVYTTSITGEGSSVGPVVSTPATPTEMKAAGIVATSCNKLVVSGSGASAGVVSITATIDGESYTGEVTLLKSGDPVNPQENVNGSDFGIVVSFEDVDTNADSDYYGLVKEQTADAPGRYYYTGQAITPTVVVRDGDSFAGSNVLVAGKDYTVKYKNNKALAEGADNAKGNLEWKENAGTKTPEEKAPCVEITLKGSYENKNGKKEVIKKYFDIIPAQFDQIYSGDAVTAAVELKSDRIASDKKLDPTVTIYSGVKKGVLGAKKTKLKNDDFEMRVVAYGDLAAYDTTSWNKMPTLKEFNDNKEKATGSYCIVVSANEATPVRLNNSGDKSIDVTDRSAIEYGDYADAVAYFNVYNKDLDLAKAKVTLSANTVSWDSIGAQVYTSGFYNIKGLDIIDKINVGSVELKEADFDYVGIRKVVGKQKELYLVPGSGANDEGIYDDAVVKANITVTPIDDISDATGIKFTDPNVTKDADAKKLTYVKVYDRTETSVEDYLSAAGMFGYGATISVNGADLTIATNAATYAIPKKTNTDPVGEEKFTVYGNPAQGYVGKFDVVFRVDAPANATAADFFYVDEDPNADSDDFSRNKTFTDNAYTIDPSVATVSFNKKMTPEVKLKFKGGSVVPAKNKLFQVKYTLPKTAGEATADIKFKGALSKLPAAKVKFTVNETSLVDCFFSDPSFKATASMNAGNAYKKAKLVVTDDGCKNKLKAGKDYVISTNVYVDNLGTKQSVSADTNLEPNTMYYLAVTATADDNGCYNLPAIVGSQTTADGLAEQTGDTIYVPFKFARTFAKKDIEDQVIYQKNDLNYLDALFATYDGLTVYDELYCTGDYMVVPCNPKNQSPAEYYGSAGTKKITLVAVPTSDNVVGSITLSFKVKVRQTDNGYYKNILKK